MGLPVWRWVVVAGYVAWAFTCTFALHGGWVVLAFFGAWGGVWLAFSLFWRWAERTRHALLHRHGYQ